MDLNRGKTGFPTSDNRHRSVTTPTTALKLKLAFLKSNSNPNALYAFEKLQWSLSGVSTSRSSEFDTPFAHGKK